MPLIEDFTLVSYLARWEHAVRYPLSSSYPESVTVDDLLATASELDRDAVLRAPLDYPPTRGSERLRAAIAGTYERIGADDVVAFAGADEAIHAAVQALLGPGDHTIVVSPAYQSLESLPASIGAVTTVPLDPERDWALDPDRVAAAVRPETRIVVINAPNNPTGAVPSAAAFAAVVALCRTRGLWLLGDEVYRGLEYDAAARLHQAADIYERGISLNVMSKAYGLPGLRVGWLASRDRDLLARTVRAKQYLSICNAGPSEALAAIALDGRQPILDAVMQRARGNLARLDTLMNAHPHLFDWTAPHAGVLAFPRFKGSEGAARFAQQLVEATGVLVVPSEVYRTARSAVPSDRLRIGFGRAHAPEALDRVAEFLARDDRVR